MRRRRLLHGQLLLQTIGSLQCLLACCLQFFQLPFPSVTPNAGEAAVVTSIIKAIVRAEYSNPATHGAAIVNEVLNDEELYAAWEDEVTGMRTRIRSMRESLTAAGEAVGADLSFAVRQAGMFSFTGLNAEQMLALREKYGVYGVANGRICIAGLNTENVTYVAEAIAGVK